MNKYSFAAFIAVPALVAPAAAQSVQQVSATQYVEAQVAVIRGATELLTLKEIAQAPDEVAAGIEQLAQLASGLVALKSSINAEELAAAEAEAKDNPETALVGQAFLAAVTHVSTQNFYNCERLAAAVQSLGAAVEKF